MTEFSTGEDRSAERGFPQVGPVHPQAGDNPMSEPSATEPGDVSRETGYRVRTAEDIAVAAPDFDLDPATPLAQAAEHTVLARHGARMRPAAGASVGHPDLRGRQPEGRRRQDHVDRERRRRARPARPAGAGRRPRPAGQRVHRARRRAPARRAVDVRRPRRRRPARRGVQSQPRGGEPGRRARDHRPGRRRDRAGLGGRPREPAAQGDPRPPAGRHRGGGGGGPVRLRLRRLPAVAGPAHPERAGGRQRDDDPDPGGVLRAGGPRSADRDRRDGPRRT